MIFEGIYLGGAQSILGAQLSEDRLPIGLEVCLGCEVKDEEGKVRTVIEPLDAQAWLSPRGSAAPPWAWAFARLRVPGGGVIMPHSMWAYRRMPYTMEERDRRKRKEILNTLNRFSPEPMLSLSTRR